MTSDRAAAASAGILVIMPRLVPIPEHLLGRAFHINATVAEGLSSKRLRGVDIQRPFPGVRSISLDLTATENLCTAYAARMPPEQFVSHVTAALLYLIPLPWRLQGDPRIHVSVLGRAIRPRSRGVVGHRLSAADGVGIRMLGRLRVADPVSTWCQLASLLDIDELIAAGDFLVSGRVTDEGRDPPLATLVQLREAVLRHAGRRGARALAVAIEHVRTGVDSPQESKLRMLLIRSGLPEPVINEVAFDDRGRKLGKPDLTYREARVVLEYEGDEHRKDKGRFRRDILRREKFEDAEIRVKRVTADDLDVRPREFVAELRSLLLRRGMSIPPSDGHLIPVSFPSRERSKLALSNRERGSF